MCAKNGVDYAAMGLRIRSRRKAMGWTQAQLARRTGLSCAFIGQLERAGKIPSLESIYRISRELELSLDALILGEEQHSDDLLRELRALLGRYGETGKV